MIVVVDCAGQVLQKLNPQIGSCSLSGTGLAVAMSAAAERDEEVATNYPESDGPDSDGCRQVSRGSQTAYFVTLLSTGGFWGGGGVKNPICCYRRRDPFLLEVGSPWSEEEWWLWEGP